jgi:hypothetical protein
MVISSKITGHSRYCCLSYSTFRAEAVDIFNMFFSYLSFPCDRKFTRVLLDQLLAGRRESLPGRHSK